MRLVFVIIMLFSTLVLAAQNRVSSFIKKIPEISNYKIIPLGKPLPSNGLELKYMVRFKAQSDAIVPLDLFFATPRGKTHVNKIGITYTGESSLEPSKYAVGFMAAVWLKVCLGVNNTEPIGVWLTQKFVALETQPVLNFEKDFGTLKIALAGNAAKYIIILLRSDKPSQSWTNTCLAR